MTPADAVRDARGATLGARPMWRRLRRDLAVVATLVAVVLVVGFLLVATPRQLDRLTADGLRAAVADAPAAAGNVSVSRPSRIAPLRTGDPLFNVETAGERFREDDLPKSLSDIVADSTFVVESPQFMTTPLPGEPEWPIIAAMRFRYQQDLRDHVALTAGQWPAPREPILLALDEDSPEEEEEVPVFEVAMGANALAELGIGIGDRVLLAPDRNDRLFRNVARARLDYRFVVEVAGVIAPIDPDDEYWYEDPYLYEPQLYANPDFEIVNPAGLFAPEDYGRLFAATGSAEWLYTWRYLVDADLLDPALAPDLVTDVRNLEFSQSFGGPTGTGRNTLITGLPLLLDRFFDQRESTLAMLSLATIGLAAVAAAVTALLGGLIGARRAEATHLVRSRGAARSQLIAATALEGVVLGVPAAALAALLAVVAVPGSGAGTPAITALLVAGGFVIVLVLTALPNFLGHLAARPAAESVPPAPSMRRRVAEVAVVILAVAAASLLRRRGLESGAGFDPLLAAAPALIALAVGIVTLRLYAVPVRFLAWLAAKQRGVVGHVGWRRILQQPAAARLPLLVLLLAVAVAGFAGTMRVSITTGQVEASWQEVGASFRITSTGATLPLPAALDLEPVSGIEAEALGLRLEATVVTEAISTDTLELLGLELDEFSAVNRGTPAYVDFTETLGAGSKPPAGDAGAPIPVIVAAGWADARGFAPGDRFTADVGRTELTLEVAAVRERFPGLPVESPFAVADLATIQALDGVNRRPTTLYLRAPEESGDALAAATDRVLGGVLTSRAEQFSTIHDAPLVAGVVDGFRRTFWLVALLALVAAVAAFVLTAPSRRRDLAYLRTVGLTSRQAGAITALEQLTPVLIAVAAGSALGFGIAWFAAPGLDLAAFTGSEALAGIAVDVAGIVIVGGGLTLAVLAAIAAAAVAAGKDNLAAVLRQGGE